MSWASLDILRSHGVFVGLEVPGAILGPFWHLPGGGDDGGGDGPLIIFRPRFQA